MARLGQSSGIKAQAVIPHLDSEPLISLRDAYPDLTCLGMPGDIEQPLGDHPYYRLTQRLRHQSEARQLGGTGNAGRRGEAANLLFERVLQIRRGQGFGSHVVNGEASGAQLRPRPPHGPDDELKEPPPPRDYEMRMAVF